MSVDSGWGIAGPGRRSAITLALAAMVVAASMLACASRLPPVQSFVLTDGTRYFIRPVAFVGSHNDASVDLTVAVTTEPMDATVNFTLPLDPQARQTPRVAFVFNEDAHYVLQDLEVLFVEATTIRYTSRLDYRSLAELAERATILDGRIELTVNRGGRADTFLAGQRFREALRQLYVVL